MTRSIFGKMNVRVKGRKAREMPHITIALLGFRLPFNDL